MNIPRKTRILSTAIMSLFAGSSFAAGFQLLEQNASGMGNAYAGSAVVAEDASTVFFNPAGMALLPQGKKVLTLGVDLIRPSTKFSDAGSTAAALQPPLAVRGGNGGDAGDLSPVPHVYFVLPVNDKISFGVGVGAPFGLKTEYDSNWSGRFLGIKSEVKTINVNPSLSYKASDTVALGFGLSYQRLEGEFTSAVNYAGSVYTAAVTPAALGGMGLAPGSAAALGLAGAAGEGSASIKGSDTAVGYNFGAIFQVSPETRLGLAYRSAIKYRLTGNANFSRLAATSVTNGTVNAVLGNPASPARGGDIYSDIKLPDIFTLSGLTQLSDKWNLAADLSWTGWSKIQVLQFNYASGRPDLSTTPENWRNTWRVAVGGTYKYNDDWKLRLGLAYDQTPVRDDSRTVRLPDNDRTWLSVGGQYKVAKNSTLDFGYTHIFVKNSSINSNGGSTAAYGLLLGNYDNSVDLLGLQYSVAF